MWVIHGSYRCRKAWVKVLRCDVLHRLQGFFSGFMELVKKRTKKRESTELVVPSSDSLAKQVIQRYKTLFPLHSSPTLNIIKNIIFTNYLI